MNGTQLLGDATEQASLRLGQTLGGLMNATFGNAVELIVGIVALVQGQLRIVQTSLIGSILSNILLVLGMAFVAGGLFRKENTFQQTAAQASGSILMLGGITVVIPAAYQGSIRASNFFTALSSGGSDLFDAAADKQTEAGLLFISRGTSIILLVIYICYLFFQLKTHAFLYEAEEQDEEEEEMKMTPIAAMLGLLAVTVVTSFNADYLVGAIDEVASEYHIPKSFIGTILLPIVGNAAEHVTSVWMAAKNKMEIALGVAVGSSIQIAIGVIPSLVIVGWIIGQPLTVSANAAREGSAEEFLTKLPFLIASSTSRRLRRSFSSPESCWPTVLFRTERATTWRASCSSPSTLSPHSLSGSTDHAS